MKKEKYRLNTVVEVRRQCKEDASREVKTRREILERETEELNKRNTALENHRAEMAAAATRMSDEISKGTSASAIVAHKDFIDNLRTAEIQFLQDIKAQEDTVRQAADALEYALTKLTEASRELTVIEKHKKKWQTDQVKRVNKQEQKLLDEISSILHERSKKL